MGFDSMMQLNEAHKHFPEENMNICNTFKIQLLSRYFNKIANGQPHGGAEEKVRG